MLQEIAKALGVLFLLVLALGVAAEQSEFQPPVRSTGQLELWVLDAPREFSEEGQLLCFDRHPKGANRCYYRVPEAGVNVIRPTVNLVAEGGCYVESRLNGERYDGALRLAVDEGASGVSGAWAWVSPGDTLSLWVRGDLRCRAYPNTWLSIDARPMLSRDAVSAGRGR